jgi:hypothetical protein
MIEALPTYAIMNYMAYHNGTVEERFWRNVRKGSGCWEWIGGINSTGRGMFWLDGKTVKAHRVSYELNIAPIPNGKLVLHNCDNGKCVRPEHLFLGTFKDNTQDMFGKGRNNTPKGDKHWNAKLTATDVNVIRGLYLTTDITQKEIAKRFNISSPTVSEIITRKLWAHI